MQSKSRNYIFITDSICGLGGIEQYIDKKIQYLEQNNWDVMVFSSQYSDEPFKIRTLDMFRDCVYRQLTYLPSSCGKMNVRKTLNSLKKKIVNRNGIMIIESHSGIGALWGELLAKELSAISIFVPLHEHYLGDYYIEKKDFFLYKLNQGTVFCGKYVAETLFQQKLGGNLEKVKIIEIQYNPIMNVDNEKLTLIGPADYSICYLGRPEKNYVPSIIEGVCEFAKNHPEKEVQFIVVGNIDSSDKKLDELYKIKNIRVLLLGELVPIPRRLFSYIDVMCAGAGSARCSVYEGKPVIVPDPRNFLANGVLGYDTISALAREPGINQMSFEEALEQTLIEKSYLKKKFIMPKEKTVEDCCRMILDDPIIRKWNYDYYSNIKIMKGSKDWKILAKSTLLSTFPFFSNSALRKRIRGKE